MRGIVTQWKTASQYRPTDARAMRMQISIAEFGISSEKDIRIAAQRARLLGTLTGLSHSRRLAFGRAVRELVENAIRHAGGGSIEFRLLQEPEQTVVEAVISDAADGESQIRSILDQDTGPDCGLRKAAGAVDRILVERDGDYKRLRIGFCTDLTTDIIDETTIAEWAGVLHTRRTQSALLSTQKRTRELAEQLANLQRQRHQLEADLQQTRSLNETLTLLSLVASKTDNAVIIMDGNGLTTWTNEAFCRMTGYATQDAIGARPDILLTGPATGSGSLRSLEQAFRHGHGVTEEFLQYRCDGSTSWISLGLTPIHDDDGAVSRWIGIGTDITRRKEAEKALKSARDAAETASRLKGEFLANISHEIRTPMNAIIGMTDLTLCTELAGDQREYLTTVKQSAESLLDLLNDVLDLSRIESGRLEINPEPVQLRPMLEETIRPLKFVAEQKGLKLSVSVAAEIPDTIECDPLRLRQVLINLVGNAIKFTHEGQVDVFVQQQWESESELGLQFTVADTGIGIAADTLDQIFEAFSQADSSISRQFGGSGLGLAITSQLLHLMSGRIWVQSEPGHGSRFHFTLRTRQPETATAAAAPAKPTAAETQPTLPPRKRESTAVHRSSEPERGNRNQQKIAADASAQVDSSQRSHSLGAAAGDRRPLRILVADDHPANVQLLCRILEKHGHQLKVAHDGLDAVRMFEDHPFDVILMDVQMPEMDGYQATAAIRERERDTQSHVPIIAVTAHVMTGDREGCLAAGMDAYISKPVSAAEVVTLIDSLSNNQTNLSAASATSTGFVHASASVAAASGPSIESDNQASETTVTQPAVTDAVRDSADESVADSDVVSDRHPFADALERLDQDEELLREQMQYFLQDGPGLLQTLADGHAVDQAEGIRISAHRLKNLCATFDDDAAAALCQKTELAAVEGDADELQKLQPQVRRAVDRLQTKLRNYLRSA